MWKAFSRALNVRFASDLEFWCDWISVESMHKVDQALGFGMRKRIRSHTAAVAVIWLLQLTLFSRFNLTVLQSSECSQIRFSCKTKRVLTNPGMQQRFARLNWFNQIRKEAQLNLSSRLTRWCARFQLAATPFSADSCDSNFGRGSQTVDSQFDSRRFGIELQYNWTKI